MALRTSVLGMLLVSMLAFGITGCKPKEEAVKVYNSIEECKADRSEDECRKAFDGSQAEQEATAPHLSLDACIAQYGQAACLPRNGGEYYLPAMTGFALGVGVGNALVYHPMYVDVYGSAYYRGSVIGSYHPGCIGCSTTVIHVSPRTPWAQSYQRTPLTSSQAAAKPAPPPSVTPSERGGFGGKGMASPVTHTSPVTAAPGPAKTFAPPTASTPAREPARTFTPPSPSSSSTPSREPSRTFSPPSPSPSRSFSSPSPSSSSSRGGFSSGRK